LEIQRRISDATETILINEKDSSFELGPILLINEIQSQQNLLFQSTLIFQLLALLLLTYVYVQSAESIAGFLEQLKMNFFSRLFFLH